MGGLVFVTWDFTLALIFLKPIMVIQFKLLCEMLTKKLH